MSDEKSEFGSAFACGYGEIRPVSMEDWPHEIERMNAEEKAWWGGEKVSAMLCCELPFWILVPDCTLDVEYEACRFKVNLDNGMRQILAGPVVSTSQRNTVRVCNHAEVNQCLQQDATNFPMIRVMKTVVKFDVEIMADVLKEPELPSHSQDDCEVRSATRRLNRIAQYSASLAFAHLPLVNRIVTSYRSTSHDPGAFEVSAFDVPFWFLKTGQCVKRICLMPFHEVDTFPTVLEGDDPQPYFATSIEKLQAQLSGKVTAGKLELLDALSLKYQGRYEDAVRSAVTAVEVCLEARLSEVLLAKGKTEHQVRLILEESRNSFFERLSLFERIIGQRTPGPLLSLVPYINGVRLREELENGRSLRHKIVHEGQRIDVFSRGSMLRVIETLTWFYEWLSPRDIYSPESNDNYAYFTSLEGAFRYPFEYRDGMVSVTAPEVDGEPDELPTNFDLLAKQFAESIEPESRDIDLFIRMALQVLEISCVEGPPNSAARLIATHLYSSSSPLNLLVFKIDCDSLPDEASANAVAAGVLSVSRNNSGSFTTIVVVNHQRGLRSDMREEVGLFSADLYLLFKECGICAVTTVDLLRLVLGVIERLWTEAEVITLLSSVGCLEMQFPRCTHIGSVKHAYLRVSVISVEIQSEQQISIGDVILIPLARGFQRQEISSLECNKVQMNNVVGPCTVGILVDARVASSLRSREARVYRMSVRPQEDINRGEEQPMDLLF